MSSSNPNPTQIYIPTDLQIKALSRLPVKSLFRFQCVSKLWCSMITSQDLKNHHMKTIASPSAPSRLLISFLVPSGNGNQLMLVSSPNPNASFYHSVSCRVPYSDVDLNLLQVGNKKVYNSVRGLSCFGSLNEVEIFNPSTRQQDKFPLISIIGSFFPSYDYFFGYDPVGDQYKVLAVSQMRLSLIQSVVVLRGDGVWRQVPWFGYPHMALTSGLCINGTLYYGAIRMDNKSSILVSFDVKLETFNIINGPKLRECRKDFRDTTLINFWGKLGVVEKPRYGNFKMWVLRDAEKEEWFVNEYQLPVSVSLLDVNVMSFFHAGEICLVPKEFSDPFYLYFYNLKMERLRHVVIEGLPMFNYKEVSNRLSVTVSEHHDSFFKFLKPSVATLSGSQLRICRPYVSCKWINIKAMSQSLNPLSSLMYSKKDKRFYIPTFGGNLLCYFDPEAEEDYPTEYVELEFDDLPNSAFQLLADVSSCTRTDHLVESPTGQLFLVKWYGEDSEDFDSTLNHITKNFMVYRAEGESYTNHKTMIYTEDIGDLCIFVGHSEALCVPASSSPRLKPNCIYFVGYNFGVYDLTTKTCTMFVDEDDDPLWKSGFPYWPSPAHIN